MRRLEVDHAGDPGMGIVILHGFAPADVVGEFFQSRLVVGVHVQRDGNGHFAAHDFADIREHTVLAGADEEQVKTVESIAADVGLAFQIQDDILDVTSTAEVLGKPVLSDEKNSKTTYVTLEGLEKAKTDVKAISDQAREELAGLPRSTQVLFLNGQEVGIRFLTAYADKNKYRQIYLLTSDKFTMFPQEKPLGMQLMQYSLMSTCLI